MVESCVESEQVERDVVVFEWSDAVTFLYDVDHGFYTLETDCVVLSRAQAGEWVEHALDCETLEWEAIAP